MPIGVSGVGGDPGQWMMDKQKELLNMQNAYGMQQAGQGYKNAMDIAKLQSGTQRYGIDAGNYQAGLAAGTQKYGYDTSLKGNMYGANAARESALGVADRNLRGQMYSSDSSLASNKYQADAARQASMFGSQLGLQGQMYGSDAARQASMYGADAAKQSSMYGADQSLAGTKYGVDATNQRFGQGLNFAQDKFGQIFNFIKDRTGGLGGTSGGGAGIPDYVSGAPPIDTSPVFSPGQIQQNVNHAVGLVDQRTAGQNMALARGGAVRGVGSRTSPLIQALMASNSAIGNAGAADASLGFRTQAAQANAGQRLDAQKAAGQNYTQNSALGLQAQKNQLDFQSALMNALVGLGNININV